MVICIMSTFTLPIPDPRCKPCPLVPIIRTLSPSSHHCLWLVTVYLATSPRFIWTVSLLSKAHTAPLGKRPRCVYGGKTYEVDIEVEAEHIRILISVSPDGDREFSYHRQLLPFYEWPFELTLGDLLGQLDSLRNLVCRWLDGALNSSVCVGTECQLA